MDGLPPLEAGPGEAPAGAVAGGAAAVPPAPGVTRRAAVEAVQRQHILAALQASGENWARAARSLGLDSSNLHKLAQRLGIKPGPGLRSP